MIKVGNDNYENPTLERLIEIMVAGTRMSGHSQRIPIHFRRRKTSKPREDLSTTAVGASTATDKSCDGCSTHESSADFGIIQTSTGRVRGLAVLLRERSMEAESGWYTLGLLRRLLHLRRKISYEIRTTTVVIAGIMTAIGEATKAETVGEEIVSTLTIGATVHLVVPI